MGEVAKNDITEDEIKTGVVTDKYLQGFSQIDWSQKLVSEPTTDKKKVD